MPHILLLEDDVNLGKKLAEALEVEGYSVAWARDLKGAHSMQKQKLPDLYLLDWNLPDGTGIEWSRTLRRDDPDVPILFMTARPDNDSAIQALQEGATDYLRKPFALEELLLRLKKAMREVLLPKDILRFGDLSVERTEMKAFYKSIQINLSHLQYRLIELFIRNAEKVLSREEIIKHLSDDQNLNDRTIDSHVSHVRKKLKDLGVQSVAIASVYGAGYKMEKS